MHITEGPGWRTFERDGRSVTFYDTARYVYHNGQPCIHIRIRGDMDLAFNNEADTILDITEGTDGILNVWHMPNDEQIAANVRELAANYAK